MKATKRVTVFLVVLPLVIAGLFFGFLPLSQNVSAMNGASLLGVILIAIAGRITYTKVLQQ